jgi:uncharacterized protein YndB with AHSA1/START domain
MRSAGVAGTLAAMGGSAWPLCATSIQPRWLVAQVFELPRQPFTDLARTALDLAPVAGLDLHPFGKASFQAAQRGRIGVAGGGPDKFLEQGQRVVQAHLGEVGRAGLHRLHDDKSALTRARAATMPAIAARCPALAWVPTQEPRMNWIARFATFGLAILMAVPAAHAAERAIDKEVVLKATLDQAWQAWTTREGITSFFAPDAVIDPRVGGAFHIHMDPGAPAGAKGADDMRFMALQPQKMLSFDWNAPPSLPEARAQRSFVVVRFFPLTETTTRVTLHHTGWGDGGEWDKAYAYFDKAWAGVLGNLQKRFDTGPYDWSGWLKQLEAYRAQAAAKAAASPSAAASQPAR